MKELFAETIPLKFAPKRKEGLDLYASKIPAVNQFSK